MLLHSLSEQLGPLTAAAGVYAVAAVVVLISMLSGRQGRRTWRSLDRKYLYGCGTLFVSYMVFLYLGLGLADNRLQVLEVGLLNYLWPILTLLFSVLLLRKKPHWLLLPATVLALIGIVLVVVPHAATPGPGGWWQAAHEALLQHPLPLWLGLAAAVTWASYSTLTRRWAARQTGGGVHLFLLATVALLVPLSVLANEPRQWSLRCVSEITFQGLATYAAYWLWDVAMRQGNIVLVAAASYLTPLLSTIVACCYLRVLPTGRLWCGCLLLMTGSLLSWWAVSRRGEPAGS